MYNKVNITELSLRVLSLFTRGFTVELYIREVQRLLAISPRSAQLVLDDLEKKGVLHSSVRGKIKLFSLKGTAIARRYVLLAEAYVQTTFFQHHPLVDELIERLIPYISGSACIFGSYARGEQVDTSDIDIFVMGSCDSIKMKSIAKTFGFQLDITCYPPDFFEQNISKDLLFKEVMKNHVVFFNADWFLRKVFEQWIR